MTNGMKKYLVYFAYGATFGVAVIALALFVFGHVKRDGMAPPLGSLVEYTEIIYSPDPGWKVFRGKVTYRSADSSVVIWDQCELHSIVTKVCP